MSQQYPAQPPKKRNTGKIIGIGCGGAFAFLLIIGIISAALGGDSDDSSKGSTVSSSTTAKATEPAKTQPKEEPTEEPAPESPVKITAQETAFTKSVLADSSSYTSVKVTVINDSDDTISVNPLYFTITDNAGTKHTHQLAADENQIDTVKLAPGENISGVITGDGKFTPEYVTYTDGFLSDPVRVEVS